MTADPGWVPPGTDVTKANVARVYDYWLGGDHNFQADRDLARTSASSSISAQASPPKTASTRSPRTPPPTHASSTWTTTTSPSRTAGSCWPATRDHRHRGRPPRTGEDPGRRADQAPARLHPARRRVRRRGARLCDGFTLAEPGLVWIPEWRPDSPDDVPEDPARYWALVGVGRYDGPPKA
jgi:hypothetical protein